MDKISYIILVPMVYAAFAVLVLGVSARLVAILRTPRELQTPIYPASGAPYLRALYDSFLMPQVRRHAPVLWVFLMAFHACLLLLLIGHLELVAQMPWEKAFPHQIFLGKGFVGLILAVSLLFFLFRRFSSPVRDLSVPEDYYLLILLFLTVIFGAEMDWARNWYGYGEMGVDQYRQYLTSLVTFHPALPYEVTSAGHRFMLVLHVFFANLFLMVLPFSKIMHAFLALPVNKLRRG